MAPTQTGRQLGEVRDQVFLLADALTEALRSGTATPQQLEAARQVQSAANLLGEAERSLWTSWPEVVPR